MRTFIHRTVLAAGLLMATASYAIAPTELPGYDSRNVTDGFIEYLQDRPKLIDELAARPDAAKKVFADSVLQRQLMIGRPLSVVVPNLPEPENKIAIAENKLQTRAAKKQDVTRARAQQEIDRAADIYTAAKDDAELREKLASGEFEAELTREGNTIDNIVAAVKGEEAPAPAVEAETSTEAQTPEEPFSVTDINAVPPLAEAQPDANGWRKYLRAPADCAAPQQGMKYIHEFVLRNMGGGGNNSGASPGGALSANGMNSTITNWFYRGGRPFDVWLSDDEIIAVPFIYNPDRIHEGDKSFGYLTSGKYRYTHHETIVAVSDCPGDFGNGVANRLADKNCVKLHGGDSASLYYGSGDLSNPYVCKLEPGKRYFLNFQIVYHAEDTPQNRAQIDLGRHFCFHRKGGNWVCEEQARPDLNMTVKVDPTCQGRRCEAGNVAIMHGFTRHPYAGPCLRNGPYPLNYNNTTCGRTYSTRRCATAGYDVTECIDPQGELASVRLVSSCEAGGSPTWIEGYGAPIHIRMQCRNVAGQAAEFVPNGQTLTFDNLYGDPQPAPASAPAPTTPKITTPNDPVVPPVQQPPVPDPQPEPEEEDDTPPATPTPPRGGGGGGGFGGGSPFGSPGGNQTIQDMIDEINRRNNTNPY